MSESGVRFGAAAALYGLTPSTLRWWESQGMLPWPGRDGGRRRYTDRDLRRIGVAYLCCVTGMMPLDRAATVTTGQGGLAEWRSTIAEQVTVLDQRVAQLTAARQYLTHLLRCTDDDMADCPHLDAELVQSTPRGRLPDADLITAARTLAGDFPRNDNPGFPSARDEKAGDAKVLPECPRCGGPVAVRGRGRPRTYCSAACRQAAHRRRGSGAAASG